MSKEFPLSVQDILPACEVMARTGRHFRGLQTFLNNHFPSQEGFPVAFSMPVFPTISANVQFVQCTVGEQPAELFDIPDEYEKEAYVDRSFIAQF